MLQFIKGESGTGKSTYITNLLAEKVRAGQENILFITPDQSSYETEKTFLELLGPMESLKVKVLGFSRICDYIFSVNGNMGKSPIDDGGKAIIMSLAIKECQDKIPLFSKTKNKNELINLMLSAVSEYKTCSITTEDILNTAKNITDETLRAKLKESSLIRDTFDALLGETYVDSDDLITQGYYSLLENNIFKDYIIALDSFSGFTNAELKFLEKLITDAKEFYISLLTDNTNNKELFFTTERTCRQLKDIAKKNNVAVKTDIFLSEPLRFKNSDLVPILRNAYRTEKESFTDIPQNIFAYEAYNKYTESDFVARTIRQLIIEEGYTYGDIAVIFRDNDSYDGIIDTVLDKYEVPYFMDKNQDIFSKPLIKLVSSIFDAINSSYQRESVLNILKSGLMPFSQEEIAVFENYLFTWDIRGSKFKNEFTDNPRGFVKEFSKSDEENLEIVNRVRKAIINPLQKFREICKDATAEEITKNLYNLLIEYKIPDNIISLCENLEDKGDLDSSSEQRRLWDILMSVLDKMINLLTDRTMNIKEYSELIMLQFDNSDMGFIPRAIDEVVVSGIERVRLSQKKAVFLMGCNEGVYPKVPTTAGVFTESERKLLLESGMNMNDSAEKLNYKEMYLAYYGMTLPSEKLFVSYYLSSLKGENNTSSSIITELKDIYPNVSTTGDSNISPEDRLWCDNSAFQFMAENIRTDSITEETLIKYFSQKEKYAEKTQSIMDIVQDNPFEIKNKENAEKLFGKDLYLSASQVEAYHLCKFKYFCQYGLRANERKIAEIDSLQYGTLMHYLMERFLGEHKKSEYCSYSKSQVEEIVAEYIEDYAQKEIGGIENMSARFKYLFYRMKDNAIKLLFHIIEELKQSQFEPTDFELKIGGDKIPTYTIDLEDGSKLSVRGSIDRVDVMKKEGTTYVRIVDYKTGTKEFALSDILYGLNLQMLIYLSAINKEGRDYFGENLVPCGVLYQPASTSFVALDKGDSGKIKSEHNKKLRMKGLILDNDTVIKGMESDAQGIFIPVKIQDDKVKSGKDNLVNLVELGKIFRSIDETLMEMANTLHSGKINYNPATDKYEPCKYCPYISVCGYEEGKNCRKVIKSDKDEVIKILSEREGE